MAKPAKYPKKLRHKLEQIKAGREERAAEADTKEAEKFDPFNLFWRAFHRPESIELMSARIDEEARKLIIRHRMRARRTSWVLGAAPWLSHDDPDASS